MKNMDRKQTKMKIGMTTDIPFSDRPGPSHGPGGPGHKDTPQKDKHLYKVK